MKKRVYILLGIALAIISFIFDREIVGFVALLRNINLDYFLISLAFASNVVIIFFFLTSLFLWQEHKRKWIIPLWLSLFFSVVISFILKVLIHRPRPFQTGMITVLALAQYFMRNSFLIWNFSFPSFQTMLVFSALPILDREFPKFKYIWFIFASLVGFSRLYFGLHYMSDIVAGAIIGYLIGLSFIFIEKRYNLGERVIKKIKNKKNNL